MGDIIKESVLETGTVMTELVAKANEAKLAGRSRRDFFASTAKIAGATALGAAGIGIMQPIAARAASTSTAPQSRDTAQDILNVAVTAETLAVTFYYNALAAGSALPSVNNQANQNYFQAALQQELEHLAYLHNAGGTSLGRNFYFPTNMFTDENVFYPTAEALEGYFISAYLAAALDFSGAYSSGITTADPFFIGVAVQILGVECEHRALLRVAQGVNPPNNVIAETGEVKNVAAAAKALTPFLAGGSDFTSAPISAPITSQVENIVGPYGNSFFPKPVYL